MPRFKPHEANPGDVFVTISSWRVVLVLDSNWVMDTYRGRQPSINSKELYDFESPVWRRLLKVDEINTDRVYRSNNKGIKE